MKYIILVFNCDVKARQTALQCLQRIALTRSQKYKSPGVKDNTFVKLVSPVPDLDKFVGKPLSSNTWLSVEETISALERLEKQEITESYPPSVSSNIENVAKSLHDAADSLPYLGSSVDTVLCLGSPECDTTDKDSIISVTGALRRLFDWHDGTSVFVKSSCEVSSLEHHLAEFAHCQVINSVDELNLSWPGWRGKVAVMDHIENKGHTFSTFRLECGDWHTMLHEKLLSLQQTFTDRPPMLAGVTSSPAAVCGRTVEVLQEVDLRTFPLCLLDSWSLDLHAEQAQAASLLEYIQDLDQTALLARVRVYPDSSRIPVCGSMHLSTTTWKDRVVSDSENMQEPAEEHVTDDWLFVYFLLLPNPSKSQLSSVFGQVLLSPHEVNRSILPVLESQIQKSANRKNHNHCRDETVAYDELILDRRDKFVMMLKLLKENLKYVASQQQGDVSKGGDARQQIWEKGVSNQDCIVSAAFHDCENIWKSLQDKQGPPFGDNVERFTESALETSKFPEKLAMQATQATRKMLQSFPSMDSLTTSSPLSVAEVDKKKKSIDFDVCDVLECFNQDGSLKEVAICPTETVRMKGHGLCKVDSLYQSKLQWPDSTLLKYHDVLYCNSEINCSLEKRYSKVRDRGYFQDTRSSFVSPIKKHQQTHSMLRRSASVQSLMTENGPKRTSPRESSLVDTFKHPTAHVTSPRKQSQGTTNTGTPELQSLTNSLRQSSSDRKSFTTDMLNKSSDNFSRNRTRDGSTQSALDISNQVDRKRSLTPNALVSACKRDRKLSALSSYDAMNLSCPVRRSPRRSSRPLTLNSDSSANVSRQEAPGNISCSLDEIKNNSFENHRMQGTSSLNTSSKQASGTQLKRSERHKLKLQGIIDHVLREKGIHDRDHIYPACSRNLFNVSMVLLKTLTTSQNLTEEMKTVVYGQVTQIINLEKRRCGITL